MYSIHLQRVTLLGNKRKVPGPDSTEISQHPAVIARCSVGVRHRRLGTKSRDQANGFDHERVPGALLRRYVSAGKPDRGVERGNATSASFGIRQGTASLNYIFGTLKAVQTPMSSVSYRVLLQDNPELEPGGPRITAGWQDSPFPQA